MNSFSVSIEPENYNVKKVSENHLRTEVSILIFLTPFWFFFQSGDIILIVRSCVIFLKFFVNF